MIIVRNLQTGAVLHRVPPSIVNHADFGPAAAIVVKADGAVAWAVERQAPDGSLVDEIRAADKMGYRVVATGPGIDAASLALAGSTLYWTQDGKPASAVLH